jgi:hypothetical protein
MVAGLVAPKVDRRPTAHLRLPLRTAIPHLHLPLQTIAPRLLQGKVPHLARTVLAPVAPVARVDSAGADLEAKVAQVAAGSLDGTPDLVAPDLVAPASAALVGLALAVLAARVWVLVARVWVLVARAVLACAVAHHRNGWQNEPSASIGTAMVN